MDDLSTHLPPRAFLLSLAALAVPVTVAWLQPGLLAGEQSLLIWLTPMIPGFLLTYHRGWAGASLALAGAMAAITIAHVVLDLAGARPPSWGVLLAVVAVYMSVTLGVGWMADLLHRERRKAQELAFTDALTGLANRRHADVFLERAHAAARRGIPVTVVLFDLDHFKSYNDRFGHAAGDAALRAFARVLDDQTRRMNLSARFGGEEFVSVLVNSDAEGALVFTERVREALAEAEVGPERITVSAGVAECPEGSGTPATLLEAADRALYRAKAEGRDRVAVAGAEELDGVEEDGRRGAPAPAGAGAPKGGRQGGGLRAPTAPA